MYLDFWNLESPSLYILLGISLPFAVFLVYNKWFAKNQANIYVIVPSVILFIFYIGFLTHASRDAEKSDARKENIEEVFEAYGFGDIDFVMINDNIVEAEIGGGCFYQIVVIEMDDTYIIPEGGILLARRELSLGSDGTLIAPDCVNILLITHPLDPREVFAGVLFC